MDKLSEDWSIYFFMLQNFDLTLWQESLKDFYQNSNNKKIVMGSHLIAYAEKRFFYWTSWKDTFHVGIIFTHKHSKDVLKSKQTPLEFDTLCVCLFSVLMCGSSNLDRALNVEISVEYRNIFVVVLF